MQLRTQTCADQLLYFSPRRRTVTDTQAQMKPVPDEASILNTGTPRVCELPENLQILSIQAFWPGTSQPIRGHTMRRVRSLTRWPRVAFAMLAIAAATIAMTFPGNRPVAAETVAADELPVELRYVPMDSALFVYADAAAIWDHPIIKSIRKADNKFIDELSAMGKEHFGHTPDDLKTVVAFVPKLKDPRDLQRIGVVVTFKKGYDKEKIKAGAEKLLEKNATVAVVPVNDRTALVLLNLGDEYAKPQPADATGPLAAAIKEAATGKHAAVAGITVENLPEEIRRDDVPAAFRPFQPLFKSTSMTATLDLGKTIDLDIRVKTGTAGQAVDCEKSLGVLLGLIQDTLNEGIKELDGSKDASPDGPDLGAEPAPPRPRMRSSPRWGTKRG